jgi:hypothetical protein
MNAFPVLLWPLKESTPEFVKVTGPEVLPFTKFMVPAFTTAIAPLTPLLLKFIVPPA